MITGVSGSMWCLPQMAPGSSLLRDLGDDSFPIGVHLTSIYSRQDPFCPPSSCQLETQHGAHLKNVEVARGGHLAFLFGATMSSIIRRELEAVEPERTIRSCGVSGRTG